MLPCSIFRRAGTVQPKPDRRSWARRVVFRQDSLTIVFSWATFSLYEACTGSWLRLGFPKLDARNAARGKSGNSRHCGRDQKCPVKGPYHVGHVGRGGSAEE